MKWTDAVKRRLQAHAGVMMSAAAILYASGTMASAAEGDPQAVTAPAEAKAKAPKIKKKELTGAELYAVNCNRCHPERYPTEFTSSQWKTIMLHMRVRANLPAKQAKKILKYLQEDSGS